MGTLRGWVALTLGALVACGPFLYFVAHEERWFRGIAPLVALVILGLGFYLLGWRNTKPILLTFCSICILIGIACVGNTLLNAFDDWQVKPIEAALLQVDGPWWDETNSFKITIAPGAPEESRAQCPFSRLLAHFWRRSEPAAPPSTNGPGRGGEKGKRTVVMLDIEGRRMALFNDCVFYMSGENALEVKRDRTEGSSTLRIVQLRVGKNTALDTSTSDGRSDHTRHYRLVRHSSSRQPAFFDNLERVLLDVVASRNSDAAVSWTVQPDGKYRLRIAGLRMAAGKFTYSVTPPGNPLHPGKLSRAILAELKQVGRPSEVVDIVLEEGYKTSNDSAEWIGRWSVSSDAVEEVKDTASGKVVTEKYY
jgi:hypothetical protein